MRLKEEGKKIKFDHMRDIFNRCINHDYLSFTLIALPLNLYISKKDRTINLNSRNISISQMIYICYFILNNFSYDGGQMRK